MWMMGLSISEKAFSFAIYIVLARFLDVDEFGIVAFCLLFLEFIAMLINSGVREYLVTRKDTSDLLINTCFISIMIVSFIIVGIFFQVFTYFLPDDSSPLLSEVLKVMIFLPILTSFNTVQISILQREFAFKQLAIRNLLSTVLAGALGVTLAYQGYGIWSLVIYKCAAVIINSIILQYLVRFIPSFKFSVAIFKSCYRFSIPLLLSEILNFWSSRVMQLFVSIFFGPSSFAILDIARKFSNLVTQVSLTALRPVCLSYLSKSPMNEKGSSHSAFSSYIAFFVIPVLISIGVFADSYVTIIFGEQWQPAIRIIEILSFAALAQGLTWYFSLLLVVNEKTKLVFIWNMVFFAVSLGGGLLSFKLSFSQYIIVQVAIINILSLFKIYYLWKTKLVTYENIKNYYIPVVVSSAVFIILSLLLKYFILEPLRTNTLMDLLFVFITASISFILYTSFSFLIFRSFFDGIIKTVKTFKKRE
tara:strand:- start:67781 stop:69205 length:1425 start_codon:yes stop_codon:yes gene_type:complete